MPKNSSKKSRSRKYQNDAPLTNRDMLDEKASITCVEFLKGEFKKEFIRKFMEFKENTEALSAGKFSSATDWKDRIREFGLGTASVVAGTVIASLGAAAIITTAAATGGGVAVAVLGIAVGIGINVVMDKRKKRQYKRAEQLLQRDDIEGDIEKIAVLLANMHADQLLRCTRKDAINLAKSCFAAISDQLLNNKTMSFNELLHPVLLQGIMMQSLKKVPKKKMELIVLTESPANTRGMLSKAALYCSENDKFYSCDAAKPGKYGVLMFSKKSEIKEYQAMVEKIHSSAEEWKYKKMQPSNADVLRQESFVKKSNKIEHLKEKESEVPSSSMKL